MGHWYKPRWFLVHIRLLTVDYVLGCQGETVKLNFALVGLAALGSESLAQLFRDDSPILTSVEPSPTTSG
jgi:hypothetical protein